jgi:hypothetical protein
MIAAVRLDLHHNVAEDVADDRAKQCQDNDNDDSDQDKDESVLYETLAFFTGHE